MTARKGTFGASAAVGLGALIASACSGGGGDASTERPHALVSQAITADAGASPCVAPPASTLFCADFDHVANVADGFTRVVSPGHGKGKLDTDDFVSASASFKAKSLYTQEVDTPPAANASATLDLDLRIDEVGAGWFAQLVTTGATLTLGLDAARHVVVTEEGGTGAPLVHTLPNVIATERWTHLQLAGKPASLALAIDGVVALDVTPKSPPTSGPRTLKVGAQNGTLLLDDILLTDPVVPGTFFCDTLPAGTTLFCDDFDQPTSSIATCNALDPTISTSPPFGCKKSQPATPALSVSANGTAAAVTLDIDLRIDQAPTVQTQWGQFTINAAAGQCPLGTTPCNMSFPMFVDATGNLLVLINDPRSPPARFVTLATFTPGTWHHLQIKGAGTAGARFFVDGTSSYVFGFHVVPGPRSFNLQGVGDGVMHFDDVAITNQ